jgi:predicted nucleotidyltransferase
MRQQFMNKEQVIETLREHQPELIAAGILRLSLFGSVARGERGNDVDLIAEFDSSRHLTLLDMVGLENRLGDILGTRVDLTPAKMLKEPVKERAAREAVVAF